MTVAELDLDLDVFAGPFDLLMAVVLREEVSLLEVELGEVVVAYVEHLEREGELELEVATEFLVLIAALLELKSRLMLPGAEEDLDELGARGGGRGAAGAAARVPPLPRRLGDPGRALRGGARLPLPLGAAAAPSCAASRVDAATAVYDPEQLGAALGDLLATPPEVDISHIRPTVSLERRLRALRDALAGRASIDFDEQFGGEDRLTQAVTLFALLELYRKGEATWEQSEPFGPIEIRKVKEAEAGMSDLARTIEALLFLSAQPVGVADLAEATEATEGQVAEAIELLREDLGEGRRGVVLREVAGGFALASEPDSEEAARRLLAKPRTPPLTQAQAETLAIVAYLQPVSRPEVARIRGVSSESAVQTLAERGLIEESGRSRFGAAIFKTTELFERLFGLSGLDQLPDPSRFDPTPEDERELRERLLKAGEQRAE